MKNIPTKPTELPIWVLLFPLLTICCWVGGFIHASRSLQPPKDLGLYQYIRRSVVHNYVEKKQPDDLLYQSLSGMMKSLDRHSRFFPPQQAKLMREQNSGSYQGIGVVVNETKPYPVIIFPMHGSPGEKAGLLPGDQILAADGKDLKDMKLEKSIELIKGPAGTEVTLTIKRPDTPEPFDLKVTRDRVETSSTAKATILDQENGIAYIALRIFQNHTVADMDLAWSKLQEKGARALILDLRYNGGGDLEQASQLVNRFVRADCPELVKVLCRNAKNDHAYAAKPKVATMAEIPLVVLINGQSASSSEVFAGAIQDWHRGVIVGEQSYGKGTVQSVVTPPAPHTNTLFKYTSARYATTSGLLVEPTSAEIDAGAAGGVIPDLPIPMAREKTTRLFAWLRNRDVPHRYQKMVQALRKKLKLSEPTRPEDPQLDAALALLQGKAPLIKIEE